MTTSKESAFSSQLGIKHRHQRMSCQTNVDEGCYQIIQPTNLSILNPSCPAVANQLTGGSFVMNCSVRPTSVFSQSSCTRAAVRNSSTNADGICDQSMASAPQSGRRPS